MVTTAQDWMEEPVGKLTSRRFQAPCGVVGGIERCGEGEVRSMISMNVQAVLPEVLNVGQVDAWGVTLPGDAHSRTSGQLPVAQTNSNARMHWERPASL
jgi:hypothetical protein